MSAVDAALLERAAAAGIVARRWGDLWLAWGEGFTAAVTGEMLADMVERAEQSERQETAADVVAAFDEVSARYDDEVVRLGDQAELTGDYRAYDELCALANEEYCVIAHRAVEVLRRVAGIEEGER